MKLQNPPMRNSKGIVGEHSYTTIISLHLLVPRAELPCVPSREVGLLAFGVCKGVNMEAIGVNAGGADFMGPT